MRKIMLPVVLASYYIVVLTRNNGAGFGTIVIVIIFCSLSIVVLFSFWTLDWGILFFARITCYTLKFLSLYGYMVMNYSP